MNSAPLQRLLISTPPYRNRQGTTPWDGRGSWKASWIRCPEAGPAPFVTAYRLHVTLAAAVEIRCHVTADERYELFVDGQRVGRGPERGDVLHWFFETYVGTLGAGDHVLVARVWSLGPKAPLAQISTRPGFLLAVEPAALSDQFDTGVAPWETRVLPGYEFQSPLAAWGTGANSVIDGERFPWGFETGTGTGWRPVAVGRAANDELCNNVPITDPLLIPSMLPPMLDRPFAQGKVRHVAAVPNGQVSRIPIRESDNLTLEARQWQQLYSAQESLTIPARTRRRILLDLGDYCCAYHEVAVSGGTGACIEIHWQESLYDTPEAKTKGNRDVIEGKFYTTTWHLTDGIGDLFQAAGGNDRKFESLWWHCGRYLQILIETRDEPLRVEQLVLRETRYPLEFEASFAASDSSLQRIVPLAWRTLQMCAHETFLDCPYFEQLQYLGDARLEALVTYVGSRDRRLPAKALRSFDWSRGGYGLTQSRYPSGVRQIIPPFSLVWIGMMHDSLYWNEDLGAVREALPGAREVLAHWQKHVGQDGVLTGVEGWNYLDWLPEWRGGVPPEGSDGGGASFNFLLQLALRQAAELEKFLGEPELAALYLRRADELRLSCTQIYWNEQRGLFADDRDHRSYSEHAQSLAILSHGSTREQLPRIAQGLLDGRELSRATIYFTHYLFEAYREIGAANQLLGRLDLWRELEARGLKTTIEAPEPTRSDCHAWAAHPLFHFFATLLGIRPASPRFETVDIAPQLGSLTWMKGTLPHPRGAIEVTLNREASQLRARVSLPAGVTGRFRCAGQSIALHAGDQNVALPFSA